MWIALALALAAVWRRPAIVAWVLAADVAADLLAGLGKLVFARPRPPVHRIGPHAGGYSFPSGHASTSFACATMLSAFAPRLRVPLYALATLIALSRLYNGDHYPTDVLAGAILGTATALLLRSANRRRRRRGRPAG